VASVTYRPMLKRQTDLVNENKNEKET
jgi:hypothetical protein